MQSLRARFAFWLLVAIAPLAIVPIGPAPGFADVIAGYKDNFEAGAAGWTNGIAPHPGTALGGPGGASDHYLRVTADGVGSSSRLVVFNRSSQWTGNYVAAGVSTISIDLKNFGTTPLSIRIAVKDGLLLTSSGYATTVAFSLPVDSQWHHAVFSLDSSALTAIGSPPALGTLLQSVPEVRILHSTSPALVGTPIVSSLGIDNVTAVPEPSTAAMLAASSLCLLVGMGWTWRRGKRVTERRGGASRN